MATGALTETVLEEVAENLEEAAEVTRRINAQGVSYFLGGAVFGIALGFFFGYRYNKEKIKAEVFKQSQEDLEEMRDIYKRREEAQERAHLAQTKPSVEEIVVERGYHVEEAVEEPERPLPPPVPISGHPFSGGGAPFAKRTADGEKSKDDGWSYPNELARRTTERPYIIHQDEFHLNESGFAQVSYTYYMGDDVMTEEDDSVLNDVDSLVGLENLNHFGHGTDDVNIVYIRNPVIDLEIEICRTPKSYEEEILGLEHSDSPNYERMRRRHEGHVDDETD